jgi:Uma2 family endonuclease
VARVHADEYLKLPEDFRSELIDGEVLPTPTPDPSHQCVVGCLLRAVCDHLENDWDGRVLPGPCDVRLDDWNVLAPDVLVLPEGTRVKPPPWKLPLPILVMEVIDPATEARDRELKLDRYRAGGVREEWIVDDDRKTIEVHDFAAGSVTVFQAGDVASSNALPGLAVDVTRLFEI